MQVKKDLTDNVEFLLKGFSQKVFNETTCVMQLTNAMYSFL